ncbi:MAG: DMP19 family protein [Planctomycetes bacterium]|nr:DMP19 family protein [Planctomycetota bacterium]
MTERSPAWRRWLLPAFAVVVAAGVAVHWPRAGRAYDLPAAQTAEALAALPDDRLVYAVVSELRWHLSDRGPDQVGARWRALAPAPRHVLALSWFIDDNGPGPSSQFTGFANHLAATAVHAPTLAELTEAYRAIGASRCAEAVEMARKAADAGGWTQGGARPEGPDPFAAANRELVAAERAGGVVGLLRAYVRAHLDELAAVRGRG